MTETELQELVLKTAAWLGWRVYHTHDSRRSQAGFPDLAMVRKDRGIMAELKSARGVVTPEQREWLDRYAQVPGVETYVWRPADWDAGKIEEVLR